MVSEKKYALGAQPSSIRELFEYGRRKAEEIGADNVFDFSLGNPSVPAPAIVGETLVELITREDPMDIHGYTPGSGDPVCRKAIADDLNRRFGTTYGAGDLFITCGAAPALTAVLAALGTDDDRNEYIVNAPFFPEYLVFAKNAGAELTVLPADEDCFQIDFAALEAAISEKTRGVLVNSPNNPSGTAYSAETVERLADILTKKAAEAGHPIYIICDEPYRELTFNGTEIPFIPNYYSNTIICYSYSKSLSLPGERIGYILVPPKVEDAARVYLAISGAARSMGHVCAPSLMQKMVARCAGVRPDVSIYERNAELLREKMTSYGYTCARPEGAFYFFFKAPNGLDASSFSAIARDRYNILIVPGGSFGCPNWLRLSFCCETEKIERALPYLEKLIEETR